MKQVVYSDHIEFRIKARNIPYEIARQVYEDARDRYKDMVTGHRIAVAVVEVGGKSRSYAVSFDEDRRQVILITIHPIRPIQHSARVKSGRWRKV